MSAQTAVILMCDVTSCLLEIRLDGVNVQLVRAVAFDRGWFNDGDRDLCPYHAPKTTPVVGPTAADYRALDQSQRHGGS